MVFFGGEDIYLGIGRMDTALQGPYLSYYNRKQQEQWQERHSHTAPRGNMERRMGKINNPINSITKSTGFRMRRLLTGQGISGWWNGRWQMLWFRWGSTTDFQKAYLDGWDSVPIGCLTKEAATADPAYLHPSPKHNPHQHCRTPHTSLTLFQNFLKTTDSTHVDFLSGAQAGICLNLQRQDMEDGHGQQYTETRKNILFVLFACRLLTAPKCTAA